MELNSSRLMLGITGIILAAVIIGMILIRDRNVETDVTSDITRVGLILTGSRNDNNFCQTHFDALINVGEKLNLQIICRENIPEDDSCAEAMDQLINKEGCRIVIAASFGYGPYVAEVAKRHEDICFLQPFGTEKLTNMTSCIGRMYQVRYLSGIVAGMRTESGSIGYVAAFPHSEVIRDINAFTLGVRSVAPDAKVYVRYCNSWTDDDAAEAASRELLDLRPEIDVLTMHTNSLKPNYVAEQRGIWSIGYNKDNASLFPGKYLTACEWRWDSYYEKKILSCLQGKFHGAIEWMDMGSGVLGLSELTANVAYGTQEAVNKARGKIENRSFDVFYGPITDSNGTVRVPEGESMADDEMMNRFDWYVEGVTVEE